VVALEFPNGVLAAVRASWAYAGRRNQLAVYGRKGAVYLYGRGREEVFVEQAGCITRVPLLDSPGKLDHFIDCIQSRRTPIANVRQAGHVMEQILKAEVSRRTGQAIELTTTFERWWRADPQLFDWSEPVL
jgi:predicted dehydrogenase